MHSYLGLRGDGIDQLMVYVAGEKEAVVPPSDMMIGEVGEKWVDEDGFMYLGYHVVLGGGLLERAFRGVWGVLGY